MLGRQTQLVELDVVIPDGLAAHETHAGERLEHRAGQPRLARQRRADLGEVLLGRGRARAQARHEVRWQVLGRDRLRGSEREVHRELLPLGIRGAIDSIRWIRHLLDPPRRDPHTLRRAGDIIRGVASPARRGGCWSRRWDSNPRPSVYETDALPLSYFGARGPILAHRPLRGIQPRSPRRARADMPDARPAPRHEQTGDDGQCEEDGGCHREEERWREQCRRWCRGGRG